MKENKLFYGSMQAHERAYRDQRAEEAKNDMILGAQVNSLVQMEEAKEKNVNDIATRYASFLKALKAKEVDLKNDATKKENDIANNPGLVVSGVVNIPTKNSSDPSNVLFTGKSAELAGKSAERAGKSTERGSQASFDNKLFSANQIVQKTGKKGPKITKLKAIFGKDNFDSMFGDAPSLPHIKETISGYMDMGGLV